MARYAVSAGVLAGALADDVAPETDPRTPSELQAETGRFGDGTGQTAGEPGRLQHDEQRLRSSSEGGEATEPMGDGSRPIRGGEATPGQIQDEQIHRAPGEQRATDGQALVEGFRGDDHEPFEPYAPGDGLDRIEAPGEIAPGHDDTGGLGLRGEPEDEGGPPAGTIAPDRDTRRARQAPGSQDRVESRKAGPDDPPVRVRSRFRPRRRGWRRFERW